MDIQEYEKVEGMTYLGYCNYLQKKYGIPKCNYFYFPSFSKNKKVTRTKDGLFVHHKYEDHAAMLSESCWAKQQPYEWQLAENLVYCDYLEHLFLHILICEYPSPNKNKYEVVGIGGIAEFIVPELNDVYSGFESNLQWKGNCFKKVINDKNVYVALLKRFKLDCSNHSFCTNILIDEPNELLCSSFNERFGLWSNKQNEKLYNEIRQL